MPSSDLLAQPATSPAHPAAVESGAIAADPRVQLAQQIASDGSSRGLLGQLSDNPFFTAGFGLAGLGAALAFAQKSVRHGAAFLRRRMLVDVEISIKDDSYPWFLYWMTIHQQSQLAPQVNSAAKLGIREAILRKLTPGMRHLSIQTQKVEHPNGSIQTRFALLPGPGKHILRYKNSFLMVDRVRESKSRDLNSGRPWETVTLTTLYSKRHIFEDLFLEAHTLAEQSREGKTIIYHPQSIGWERFGEPRRKRPLDSVVLDDGIKERIVNDVKGFLRSSKWYYDRGIPYRRGYLLHGPPGTGKSSFIQALAGELDYNIAIMNLSQRGLTDDRFSLLLSNVPSRSLVLLEDVDAAFSNRRTQSDEDGYRGANVTFSGLLNALDGVASAEERITFLTTNHIERLDEALIRPGRVDMTVRLGELTRWQAAALWDRFYGDLDRDGTFKKRLLQRLQDLSIIEDPHDDISEVLHKTSPAALQGLFLYNKDDMEGAIDMALGLIPEKSRVSDFYLSTNKGSTSEVPRAL